MKQTFRFAKWLWFLPVAMIVALGWILSGAAAVYDLNSGQVAKFENEN